MFFYSYDEFEKDIKSMAREIRDDFSPDAILAIARGGMTIGHFIAIALQNRNLFSLNSIHYDEQSKLDTINIFNIPDLSNVNKILVVDDIVDSGESMAEIKKTLLKLYPHLDIKIATIFYKKTALLMPDYKAKEATEWIEFFWDITL
ncbi:putative nucleotide phosphoribosyltransferase [Campylobacter pinnipediorum subsp. caledonicus]|uniref:Nicotinate phosphoribosyltransferase n=2 Tax=Campylobacter pinnipediorum TaxID=1965231 RepID=A0AAX0L842_9BACT|nr:phosphoribosyltransferase family protein [Campylobacter pinnipediorum]AQW85712.1 putative nucleotide phosphoribosyltransferase [Campylobacter pinnipediorum subsp. caledonicus]AQW87323.1 putative nucleotide phosphoribosyltransferase [Campylobacter pinnipediorum subsp. caledonicus]OPA72460.1 nicotinate phosphoribosyltransferase [Campylobacter pinnipediorum subsp. caledonicus]OPA74449.1 nicotinate phosphoribosyltransferase [Campylobacter pinnipediorum subsp. pinnipediorum]